MGQLLHGSATTTEAVRRAIQTGQESVRVLARRYGISHVDGLERITSIHRYQKGSAQDLLLIERRHYQPKTALPLQLSFCVRF
jgi:hypothetical protein